MLGCSSWSQTYKHASKHTTQPSPTAPPGRLPLQGIWGLLEHLVAGVTVQQPVWISRLERAEGHGQWDVYGERGRLAGRFSHVVIAHNGKCADKLVSAAGAPRVHQLLRTKFCPKATTQQVGFSAPTLCTSLTWACLCVVLPGPRCQG
jgi:hypothetical protein